MLVECGWMRFSGNPVMILSTPACWSTSCDLVLDGAGCLPWWVRGNGSKFGPRLVSFSERGSRPMSFLSNYGLHWNRYRLRWVNLHDSVGFVRRELWFLSRRMCYPPGWIWCGYVNNSSFDFSDSPNAINFVCCGFVRVILRVFRQNGRCSFLVRSFWWYSPIDSEGLLDGRFRVGIKTARQRNGWFPRRDLPRLAVISNVVNTRRTLVFRVLMPWIIRLTFCWSQLIGNGGRVSFARRRRSAWMVFTLDLGVRWIWNVTHSRVFEWQCKARGNPPWVFAYIPPFSSDPIDIRCPLAENLPAWLWGRTVSSTRMKHYVLPLASIHVAWQECLVILGHKGLDSFVLSHE